MESINTPKLDNHFYLVIGDILFHNVTQFQCCFMSDDHVRLHVEVVSFSSQHSYRLLTSTPKKGSQDYECSLPGCEYLNAQAWFSSFFLFFLAD